MLKILKDFVFSSNFFNVTVAGPWSSSEEDNDNEDRRHPPRNLNERARTPEPAGRGGHRGGRGGHHGGGRGGRRPGRQQGYDEGYGYGFNQGVNQGYRYLSTLFCP